MSILTPTLLDQIERFSGHRDDSRRTGKSTRLAFLTLAECYEKPGTWIRVNDHYEGPQADRYLLQHMQKMLDALGFRHFEFKTNGQVAFIRLQQVGERK